MKDNEDEQVNNTYINNCFNQTISNVFFCKHAATDVLKTTSIPLNFTPSMSVTATDRLQTLVASLTLIARSGLGIFVSGQTVRKLGNLVPCKGSRQHALHTQKGAFQID